MAEHRSAESDGLRFDSSLEFFHAHDKTKKQNSKGYHLSYIFVTVSEWRRANARKVSFKTLYGGQFTLSTQLIILNYLIASLTFRWASFTSRYENNYAVHGEPRVQREWQSILGNQCKFCFPESVKGSKLNVRIQIAERYLYCAKSSNCLWRLILRLLKSWKRKRKGKKYIYIEGYTNLEF